VFLLYIRALSTPTTFIYWRCGCPVLTVCEILLPRLLLLLHHLHVQTELRRKPRVNVRLHGMLRRHELLLLLLLLLLLHGRGRIRRRKAELW